MHQDLELGKFRLPDWTGIDEVPLSLVSGAGLNHFIIHVFAFFSLVTWMPGCKRACILGGSVQNPILGTGRDKARESIEALASKKTLTKVG